MPRWTGELGSAQALFPGATSTAPVPEQGVSMCARHWGGGRKGKSSFPQRGDVPGAATQNQKARCYSQVFFKLRENTPIVFCPGSTLEGVPSSRLETAGAIVGDGGARWQPEPQEGHPALRSCPPASRHSSRGCSRSPATWAHLQDLGATLGAKPPLQVVTNSQQRAQAMAAG